LFFVVFGILQADSNGLLMAALLAAGLAFLFWFFLYIRGRERAGKEALLSTRLFKNRTSNLGLVTQNIQWLLLMGVSFTVSVFLQTVGGHNAIETESSSPPRRSEFSSPRSLPSGSRSGARSAR
jgi:Na+/melibiose symporter-like transporter